MSDYQRALREQALVLPKEKTPGPWNTRIYLLAGGVLAAGWNAEGQLLLISPNGYSLTQPRTGNRIERNRDSHLTFEHLANTNLTFILSATLEAIPIFGVWGGGISVYQDWQLRIIAPDRPNEMVVLWDPTAAGEEVGQRGYFAGAHHLDTRELGGELRGCGFAPSGQSFVVVASDGALIWSR